MTLSPLTADTCCHCLGARLRPQVLHLSPENTGDYFRRMGRPPRECWQLQEHRQSHPSKPQVPARLPWATKNGPPPVTGRVTRQCHNLKELEADKATGKPGHEKAFQSSWGLTTGSAHFPTPDSLIGSTSFSSDASMLASLVSKLRGFKSKTK